MTSKAEFKVDLSLDRQDGYMYYEDVVRRSSPEPVANRERAEQVSPSEAAARPA